MHNRSRNHPITLHSYTKIQSRIYFRSHPAPNVPLYETWRTYSYVCWLFLCEIIRWNSSSSELMFIKLKFLLVATVIICQIESSNYVINLFSSHFVNANQKSAWCNSKCSRREYVFSLCKKVIAFQIHEVHKLLHAVYRNGRANYPLHVLII